MSPRVMPTPRRVLESAQPLVLTAALVWALLDESLSRHGRPPAADVCVALLVLGWCVWVWSSRRPAGQIGALTLFAVSGGVLAMVATNGPGTAAGATALAIAATGRRPEASLAVLGVAILGTVIAAVVAGTPPATWLGCAGTFLGCWVIGGVRRSYGLRAEEAEHALAQERRAVAAEKHAAALEERTRIAREIHDILAHSLSALSVNLSAAEGFLADERLPAGQRELVKAQECVRRAGRLAREGMAETRQAVLALREDLRPLTEALAELAETHGAAVEVTGSPVEPSPAAGLVAFRTAQEALTNARKHAPGAAVRIRLDHRADVIELTVRNAPPEAGVARPLADSGTGHGLTGLAERAAVVGGVLEAGVEDDGGWRVRLRISS
ncbi:sensor histidine kinase [Actinoallomurus iriomotensis]|uniref:histidine kinase n=1 Tax=Actinoallomurus iriomotensis TaxID=478107 RepID=A0A9W6W4N6_9ACTN|nr:histidine kinase [Actinoallomurus iriomotensis]GLY90654.1 two-component sensor histidine kinase [Actinoallomurus iriomotensis]